MPRISRIAPPTTALCSTVRSGVDMARVKARADKVSADARTGVETWLRGMPDCTVLTGAARFTGPHTLDVGGEAITAPKIFLNVGGRAVVPDIPGVHDVPFLTNTSMLALDRVPKHLVIIGGSYIGLEFAQMFRRFGADVTVVEKGPRLIPREDEATSEEVRAILEREGIRGAHRCGRMHPRCETRRWRRCRRRLHQRQAGQSLARICCSPSVGGRTPTILASHVAGISDRRTRLSSKSTTTLQTNVAGVWALGDCNGRGAFTHTSYNDFEIVAANLLDGAVTSGLAAHPGLCALHQIRRSGALA